MMLTVMKFGGTSVGSKEAIERVAKIIAESEGRRVAVVSAMSGITNFLVGVCASLPAGRDEALQTFRSRHMTVAESMFSGERLELFRKDFEKRMEKFTALLNDDEARLKDPYYEDNLTSQGERFSSLLLSHKLQDMGVPSAAVTSEDAGVVATGRPLNGEADLQACERRMHVAACEWADPQMVPVITGFYGCSEDGHVITFGRGGSDYAAAVIANALDADRLEIWTDVNGFMSTDPRIVPAAVKIDEMTYAEASELAYFGAKVLHPRTIEPVRRKHIPLWVKNSFKPEENGTKISQFRKPKNEMLRSVAAKTDLSILTIFSPEIAYRPEIAAKILTKLSDSNDAIYSISTSLSTLALLIHNNDVRDTLKKLNGLDDDVVERIDVTSDVALICCVGDDLMTRCGASGDIFGAVKDAGANVNMISEGASSVSLNFVVPMEHAMKVLQTLHQKFVEE